MDILVCMVLVHGSPSPPGIPHPLVGILKMSLSGLCTSGSPSSYLEAVVAFDAADLTNASNNGQGACLGQNSRS